MPIYEYWCPKCQKEFQLMRPFAESGETGACPTCGTKSEKLVSLFASKENYTIKVPRGEAYRGQRATPTAAKGASKGAAKKR